MASTNLTKWLLQRTSPSSRSAFHYNNLRRTFSTRPILSYPQGDSSSSSSSDPSQLPKGPSDPVDRQTYQAALDTIDFMAKNLASRDGGGSEGSGRRRGEEDGQQVDSESSSPAWATSLSNLFGGPLPSSSSFSQPSASSPSIPIPSNTFTTPESSPSPSTTIPSPVPPPEDPLLSYLTNLLMKSGQKSRARTHLLTILSTLRLQYTTLPPLQILQRALETASPSVRVVTLKKGGKNTMVPVPMKEKQRLRKGFKWILEASDKRKGSEKVLGRRVAMEVVAVLTGQSEVLRKKEEVHRVAMLNRANTTRI